MTSRKIYCQVIEGIVWEDRCLFKLAQIVKDNKVCDSCILRELEKIKASDFKQIGTEDGGKVKNRRRKKYRRRKNLAQREGLSFKNKEERSESIRTQQNQEKLENEA